MSKSKGFSTNNPLDNLSKVQKDTPKDTKIVNDPEQNAPKRKIGRPKTKLEPTRNINIAVPVAILDKLDEIKTCYGGNMTRYINSLIEKDLDENYEKYTEAINVLNKFN